jgi:spore coat protein U-like protein
MVVGVRRILRLATPIGLVLLFTSVAKAADTATFAVSAQIVPGCTLIGSQQTSGINFGTLNFGSHAATTSGQVGAFVTGGSALQLDCTPGIQLNVSIDGGLHASNSGTQRNLVRNSGTGAIVYSLYTTPAATTAIPVGQSVAVTVPSSGVIDLPIYGRATLPGTGLSAGVYTDTLQVTLTW